MGWGSLISTEEQCQAINFHLGPFTINIHVDQGKPCHFIEPEAVGSLTWLRSCQQHIFIKDFFHPLTTHTIFLMHSWLYFILLT